MKVRIQSKSSMILVLTLLSVVLTGLSAFFFNALGNALGQVVNSGLYRYGLSFYDNWAVPYWTCSRLLTICLTMAIAVTSISGLFTLFQTRTQKTDVTMFVGCLLLLVGITSAGLSAVFFSQIDNLVRHDLYAYGLEFSNAWAAKYWTDASLFLGLAWIATAVNCVSLVLLAMHLANPVKLIGPAIFSAGSIVLALAISNASSILAFAGLALVIWAGLLFYIRPEKYVKGTLLDKMSLPPLESLNEIIIELGYKRKGVYLPPKYFSDFESGKVYLSTEDNPRLPTPEEIQKDEHGTSPKNLGGMLITAPGYELAKLFEKTLDKDFAKTNLKYIEDNIPRLLVELEIAQKAEMHSAYNVVNIRIEGAVTKDICEEIRKLSSVCGSLGCPLCSSIALALTKATGKPLIIDKDVTDEDGRIIEITYHLLNEPQERTS